MKAPTCYLSLLLLLTALLAPATRADEMADAALALCEKVKACSLAEIEEEDLTPEMREMMQPMLDNMCANMNAKVEDVPTGHALYQPALACMRSMAALSCQQMQSGQVKTPACQAYEEMVMETYGDS